MIHHSNVPLLLLSTVNDEKTTRKAFQATKPTNRVLLLGVVVLLFSVVAVWDFWWLLHLLLL